MSKPLLRVTQLEKFRRFLSGDYDYETEQGVMDTITGEFQGNEYTWIGTALHAIVETGNPVTKKIPSGERRFLYRGKEMTEPVPCGRLFEVEGHRVVLDVEQCKTALKYRDEHPGAFHEIRRYKDYGGAVVTGCADLIDCLEIRDIKTKYSAPDDKDYLHSCQWRYYLDIFGTDTFHFDLFVFDGYNKERHGTDVRGLPLLRYLPAITCYRYEGMEQDNRWLLDEFLRWARFRKLIDKLPIYKN